MTQSFTAHSLADPRRIRGFHAHIYYDTGTRPAAETLRQAIVANFTAELGRWHDKPVGPHTVAMYQVAFAPEEFGRLVPWLTLNRSGLDILVHPQTGDAYEDHTAHALWLGTKLPLKLHVLGRDRSA